MKKFSKQLLSVLLSVIMVFLILPSGVFTASALTLNYRTGDFITFGTYPQTKVTSAALISTLNSQPVTSLGIAVYNGTKYMKVIYTNYIPYILSEPLTSEYSYQDDNGFFINKVYWFKFEPIVWRVLSNTGGKLFVMAEKLLDSRIYKNTLTDTTWETSGIRTWLNNSFYNFAFADAERAMIAKSLVVNSPSPYTATPGGNDTNDYLYLLSYSEVMNTAFGFNADASANDAARTGFGTDFAKSKGLFIDVPSSVTGISYWWLRSPGRTAQFAGAVSCFNTIKANDNWEITYTDVGIRPVFNLDLSKITKTTSIKLSPASLTWPVGKSSTVTVITTPGNATLKGVTWSSSNTAVATVSGTGKITAKSVGISTIMAGAKDGSGKTAACTIAVVPPAPASLTAVKSTSTSVKLTWSKVTGVTGYEVYRSTIKTGTYSKVVSLSGNTILIAGLSTGRTYYFKVRAYKTFGSVPFKSPFTSIKSVAL